MINLEKGARVSLDKESPGLKRVRVGLGWNPNKFDSGQDFDLDVSAFVLSSDKLLSEKHFVFYNNLKSPNNAVVHKGDERTGNTDGDDETILVDLSKLESQCDEVSFIVTIHQADSRKQNFGQVSNSYITIYNDDDGTQIAKYNLEDDFSVETSVQFGSLYKKDDKWLFKAVGAGYKRGLSDFVSHYGA